MNIRWDIAAMVAVAGLSASMCAAQQGDNTRRGLNRGPSAPAAAPAQASPPQNNAPQRAAPSSEVPASRPAPTYVSAPPAQGQPGLVRPVRVAPPVVQPSQNAPTPRAVVPQHAEPRSTPVWTPRQRAGTPQNPATVDQTKRALNRDPAPKSRPIKVVQLPSGDDTARSRLTNPPTRDDARRGTFPVAASGVSARATPPASPTSSSSIVLASGLQAAGAASIARSSDNTRRNLVKPIPSWNGGGGGGDGNWNGHGHHGNGHQGNGWNHNSGHGHGWGGNSWNNGWNDTYYGNSWYGTSGIYHDPWTNWSSGIPTGTLYSFGGFGRDPWSYSTFSYGGPGWYPYTDFSVQPYEFSYQPYLGQDVWQLDSSGYSVGTLGAYGDPYATANYSGGLPSTTVTVPEIETTSVIPPVEVRSLPRVNPSYDVRGDFSAAVEAALNGEFSSSVYAMRKAAGTNPGGLVGRDSLAGRSIANDGAWAQRVRAALLVFRDPPRRVVSETDAQFMVGALSAAMGNSDEARAAVDSAIIAGDAAVSTHLLGQAVRGEPLEAVSPWVTGRPAK